jgi:hypothetical protein
MSELEDLNGHVGQDERHERWLAMQSAYAEYTEASEIFKNSLASAPDSADPARRDWTLLDGRQDAYERYLEARIEYLERRFDEGYTREEAIASPPIPQTGKLRFAARLSELTWPIVLVLVVGMLSVTMVSFAREQKRVRDLDSARDQLRSALSDTHEEFQLLVKELDAWESNRRSAVRQVKHTAPSPAPAPPVNRRKTARTLPPRSLPENSSPSRIVPESSPSHSVPESSPPHSAPERMRTTTSGSVVAPGYFSLSNSSHSTRVGPFRISLISIDMPQNSAEVFIGSEAGVNVQRLRLNQPIRIKGGDGQPMELIVDRITSEGLSGRLI